MVALVCTMLYGKAILEATRGSHGCINMAMRDVGIAYNYAKVNMPIVCYYHERISAFKPISAYERNKG